jgi:phosphate/sulfate permease
LLGAAVAISIIKIIGVGGELSELGNYINTQKATEIIIGIILSVLIAFTIGAIIQLITRVLITFKFNEQPKWTGSIFGGIALTSIVYFILVKGLKSANLFDGILTEIATQQTGLFILVNLIFWSVLSRLVTSLFKWNIYTVIIVVGTFALAMAFAGNDLVNFIGVPIAAMQSFTDWQSTGVAATEYTMESLTNSVQTPIYLLLASGLIMIITLWFSTKARNVVKTSVDLARQDEGEEKFQPNFLSRQVVKYSIKAKDNFNSLIPIAYRKRIDQQFAQSYDFTIKSKRKDLPAFDLVRAAVNLMVASVLISIATSMKLPLSTTYVTFMVAMGTSLADRAWGTESAVYRVAGVFNVIGGWFLTAITAFTASALIAVIIHWGGFIAVILLLVFAAGMLLRNYLNHRKNNEIAKIADGLRRAESSSIQGVIQESADNITNVINRSNKIYTNSIDGMSRHDIDKLKKSNKQVLKLSNEIDDLRDNIFYFIKNLDENSIGASNFYLRVLDYLQDMAQSLEYISKISYKHVNNNHKKLTYSQIKELKSLDIELDELLSNTKSAFENRDFHGIGKLLVKRQELFANLNLKIARQITRTRQEESSPKNTTLYFNLLTETKDLVTATMNLLEIYYEQYDSTVRPAFVE